MNSKGNARLPRRGILRLVLLKKPDAQLEKGPRGFRAIALLSVFSKWYTTVRVELLRDEKEPIEWRSLHVGTERGVNRIQLQALVTSIFQRHWGWQEDRPTDLQPGFLQIQHGIHSKFGRENGV